MCEAWKRHFDGLENVIVHQGDLFDLHTDAVVSPANSFGFMDGGLDAAITRRFGKKVENQLQLDIREKYYGELLVGQAHLVKTGNVNIPYVIAAPTMRVPMVLKDTVNVYLATKAAFRVLMANDDIETVTLSGMGTGVGKVPFGLCANQMREAYNDIMLGFNKFPESWYQAQYRHSNLFTDTTKELQNR